MKTLIIHHVNRDFTHKVIETRTVLGSLIIKSEFSNAILL